LTCVDREEQPRLLPLPAHPLETDRLLPIHSGKTIYVRFDLKDYSIPPTAVGRALTLLASTSTIRILQEGVEIARHRRSWDRHQALEDPAHRQALLEEKRRALGASPSGRLRLRCPFEVYAERPADSTLLLSSIEVHQQRFGRLPRMVAADARFYSRENEKAGQALGARWMSVPNKNTKSIERKLLTHQRWFRRGQKWRTGSEGRISVLKRRHGLRRCLYPGLDGMRRWVGLGVIADNVIQMGCYLARQS
jgi:hypothetical protein